jgi:hypothetical protein
MVGAAVGRPWMAQILQLTTREAIAIRIFTTFLVMLLIFLQEEMREFLLQQILVYFMNEHEEKHNLLSRESDWTICVPKQEIFSISQDC